MSKIPLSNIEFVNPNWCLSKQWQELCDFCKKLEKSRTGTSFYHFPQIWGKAPIGSSNLGQSSHSSIRFVPTNRSKSNEMPKVPIFRCPKMGLRAPESKNGDHFFTRTPPQNGGLGICFMCLPRKVIFGHFIDFEYFGSDFSCFYIVKTPKIEMASRLSFMGL